PFLSSCGLPSLPGTEPLGGKVLSHDFVEASLMRNAGWEVWFAYDLEGSYEGLPPTLTEYVKRDRRWCQGNLQHVWFLLARNVRLISRIHLIQGILAYASSPLLVGFIFIGGLQATLDHFHHHTRQLPHASAAVLFITTLGLLFGPKVLSLLHLFSHPKQLASFGGTSRLLVSVLFETLFSIVSAPIMIWFHTRFVLRNLSGQTVTWTTQMRQSDSGPRWGDIIAEYWPLPLVASGIGLLAWWLSPTYLAWLSPLLLGLILSIPLAKLSGNPRIFHHLFVTPEESEPTRELAIRFSRQLRDGDQFIHALVDPFYNAVHVALQRHRNGDVAALDNYLSGLAEKLFRDGPDALSPQEKRALLADGTKLAYLHTRIWKTPAQMMSPIWSEALAQYRARHRSVRPEPAAIEARLASAQPFAA
ncbi:MAG: glucans biosynthesis glucosyltransferase MdoH, partial [Verrucomicrobia bacterium]|nr:glucans biosynthesis glucosyltransferase MdoH [Verrucomicrobiota bacterium]